MKRDQAPDQQHDAEAEDQDFFSKGEINEGSDHVGLWPAALGARPLPLFRDA